MNKLSDIAKEITLAGLDKRDIKLPKEQFFELAKEIYNVPEKPEIFIPRRDNVINKEVAVLVTGGLDSTALYFWAKEKYGKVRAFYILVFK